MGRLDDKVALITGGAGGIGIAAAKRFIDEGARIMLVDVNEQALRVAVDELGNNVADYCVADVSDPTQTDHYVEKAVEKYGGLDIYLANAGIEGQVSPLVDYDIDMFDKVLAVNVRGVFLGLQSVFPRMQAQGGGSIVITSSIAGIRGGGRMSAYVTSKHAVIGLMKSAALEGASHNIRVNTVNPSPVETNMMRRIEEGSSPGNMEAVRERMKNSVPLQHYADPSDVANLMLFLASDESRFITGSVYMVDGGSSA
jgi:NAD(P)-dependent dehydrogenase (short-subunit alcohol dehydrogenase family)